MTKTQKIITKISICSSLILGLSGFMPLVALADSLSVDFESPTYTVGSVNGQDGWNSTGSFDQGVVAGPSISGSQSLRISDAVTSGSFGDQTFSKSLLNEAGESNALNNGYSGGVRKPHFEAQFDIEAIEPGSTDVMSVSPDRGDGARMSYLRFEDETDGVHVFFVDVTDPTHAINGESFNETDIATLDASVAHTVKFSMDFVNGPDNDVVKVYLDGVLTITGTSWEDYYLFDTESNPSLTNNSRTVDSLLFREGGVANPNNSGKGYLIDNLSLLSSAVTPGSKCDANSDGSITMADLTIIRNANGQVASGPNDPRDGNSDGGINIADVRYCQLRQAQ